MKHFLLSVLLVLFLPSMSYADVINGRVVRVLDGDTVDVLLEQRVIRVRLANIDAPEKKQAYGRWSMNQLKSLVASGESVRVVYAKSDRYGRVLGRVFTQNDVEANSYMVRVGAAWVYEAYNTDHSLPALQREAQAHKRGLWADSNPVPPWVWRKAN